jgi:hypothetical protein
MRRANPTNLRQMKAELMKAWNITEETFKVFVSLVTKYTWEDYWDRRSHTSFAKREYMQYVNNVIKGSGVDSLYPDLPDIWYVNMGDTYATTVILKDDKLYIGTWGDVVEKYA